MNFSVGEKIIFPSHGPCLIGAVVDKLVEALKGQTFEIISTNLPQEKEDELRAAFGAE